MTRAVAETKIEKVLSQAREMVADTRADKAMKTCMIELLEFCKEATVQIDKACSYKKPIRAGLLLEALQDVERDSAIIESALCLDPSYHALQEDLSQGIEAFTDFVNESLPKMPILLISKSMSTDYH